MALPFSYNVRNLIVRWRVTTLAVGAIALVVAVLVVLISMAQGFRIALQATGSTDNAVLTQRGSTGERKYYDDQSAQVSLPLLGLAGFVAIVMGIGAVFGAMNTMYAIVAARTREIGTLRALGFSRFSILVSFVTESTLLALAGGILGCLVSIPANGVTSAAGGANFAEVSFAFQITPPTIVIGLVLAVLMGLAGGLLPAWRASRVPITAALRS